MIASTVKACSELGRWAVPRNQPQIHQTEILHDARVTRRSCAMRKRHPQGSFPPCEEVTDGGDPHDRRPAGRRTRLAPWWVASPALIGVCCALVLPLHGLAFRWARWAVSEKSLFWRSLVSRSRGPSRLALLVIVLAAAASTAPLTWEVRLVVNQVLLVAFVTLVGGACATAIHIATVIYLRRFKLDAEDTLLARKHFTQMRILERAALTLVALVTIGIAMQPVLSNPVAGLQIAITQPIRIEDAVIVENAWGWSRRSPRPTWSCGYGIGAAWCCR